MNRKTPSGDILADQATEKTRSRIIPAMERPISVESGEL